MATRDTEPDWEFLDSVPGSWTGSYEESTSAPNEHFKAESPTTEDNPPKPRRTHYPSRTCRICLEVVEPTFETVDTDAFLASAVPRSEPRVIYTSPDGGRLMSPCKCKGSQKYVHEECLNAWRRSDPMERRNYWECPTCRYRYRLERLTWSSWISSTTAQVALTLAIFLVATFVLGFVADPIINMYFDPINTIATGGGPGGSLIYDDGAPTWPEHFVKGLASLGLLGFAKFLFSLSPFQFFNARANGGIFGGRRGVGGTGRDRLAQISWITIVIGIATFLWAVWQGVRAWSKRTLKNASERVMDVPGEDDDHE